MRSCCTRTMADVLVRRGHRCSEKGHMITKVEARATHLSGREHQATGSKRKGVETFQHLLRFLISKTVRAENECVFGFKAPRLWWLIRTAVGNKGRSSQSMSHAQNPWRGPGLRSSHPKGTGHVTSLSTLSSDDWRSLVHVPATAAPAKSTQGGRGEEELRGALFLFWPYTGIGQSSLYSIESLQCHYAYQDVINPGKQWYLEHGLTPLKIHGRPRVPLEGGGIFRRVIFGSLQVTRGVLEGDGGDSVLPLLPHPLFPSPHPSPPLPPPLPQ